MPEGSSGCDRLDQHLRPVLQTVLVSTQAVGTRVPQGYGQLS